MDDTITTDRGDLLYVVSHIPGMHPKRLDSGFVDTHYSEDMSVWHRPICGKGRLLVSCLCCCSVLNLI